MATRSSTSTRGWPTRTSPETIAFLEAENAYTEAMTAGQAGLREAIFGEIKARTKETDLSVPSRKGGWWYYVHGRSRASSTRCSAAGPSARTTPGRR